MRQSLTFLSIILIAIFFSGCNRSRNSNDNIHVDDTGSSDDTTFSDTTEGTESGGGGCVEEDPSADTETETSADTNADSATVSDTASEDSDTPSNTTDTADTDSVDTDSVIETDTATADTDTPEPDSNYVPPDTDLCPADMLVVAPITDSSGTARFCIDRYEASRADATANSQGSDDSIAMSTANVLPWYVRPMNDAALKEFKNACEAAGKYLCTAEEWEYSCSGPKNNAYVFEADPTDTDFDFADYVEICNNVATYCDDYCVENGVSEEDCNTYIGDCGYSCGDGSAGSICFHVAPTGQFRQCTNEIGTYDICGNVWEIVTSGATTAGYEIRGGAFNCASPNDRLKCTYTAGWTDLYAGFRCCKDIFPQ
jgi:hypothetical protein